MAGASIASFSQAALEKTSARTNAGPIPLMGTFALETAWEPKDSKRVRSSSGDVARAKAPETMAEPRDAATWPDFTKIERALDLRRLRYFVQIVAEGSFSTAARRLRVAQPALSHHVRELEAILGLSLLTRSAHGVVPTEAGRCLHDHSLAILAKVRRAASEIEAFGTETPAHVSIGLTTALASILAVPLMKMAQLKMPGLSLGMEEGAEADILRRMEDGRLDLALSYGEVDKAMARTTLLTEGLHLVGPPDCASGAISFAEVATLPLILPRRRSELRERMEHEARRAGLNLKVVIESDGVASVKKLVQAGLGFSIMSAAEVADEERNGFLSKKLILDPCLKLTLSLIYPSETPMSTMRVRRLVMRIVSDLLRQATWPGLLQNQSISTPSGPLRDPHSCAASALRAAI